MGASHKAAEGGFLFSMAGPEFSVAIEMTAVAEVATEVGKVEDL